MEDQGGAPNGEDVIEVYDPHRVTNDMSGLRKNNDAGKGPLHAEDRKPNRKAWTENKIKLEP